MWGGYLDSDSLQFGFKSGTGTDQCTWLLSSVAEHHLLRGSPTLCSLGCEERFPKCEVLRSVLEVSGGEEATTHSGEGAH